MLRAPFDSENRRMHSGIHSRAPSWARTRPSFPPEYVLPRDRDAREGGDGDLIFERARNNAPELDSQAKVVSLQIGLRHLRDAYVEAKNQCQGALDGFDTATQMVASFAGPKAICQLWQDYLRHRHSTRVGMDTALDGVNYCLLNLGQQRNRITLPKPFGKHLSRIVKRGQHIIRDSAEAKTEHRAANRLVMSITAAAADVDPDSEANYRMLYAVDASLIRQNNGGPKTNKSPEDDNTDANDGNPV
ncbi:hypothetical protein D7B24_009067 [Verticillium nonalfalfae]|uniref:Uncharacterized protein n=1 Tax=Verticillium nonalfalfae TaxID=1051616 RepID=A0A3M9Y3G8_9PEZI|nr:uncharacterized protein D7B24_009067 [Verticillium nonalfalfae]RNJ55049.1 hypothetical protein D7B24_009067 [Verticillium nonalfalfae]